MWFRTGPANRFTRLVASLLLASFGVGFLFPLPPLGIALILLGLSLSVWQGVQMARERRGKYDLMLLRELHEKDVAREEPEPDRYEQDMVYCHRCALSFPDTHSICPQCGAILN